MKAKKVLIGDSVQVGTAMYEKVIPMSDVQVMSDLLCESMSWPRVECVEGRQNTLRRHGCIKHCKSDAPVMVVNKPSEGLVLHELAHLCKRAYPNQRIKSHGYEFKITQEMLYVIWNGKLRGV